MKKVQINKPIKDLLPVDVQCSTMKCDQGFHYYTSDVVKTSKGQKKGDCKGCGDSTVDWNRIHNRNTNDVKYTFDNLKKELLRHVCWSFPLDEKTVQKAYKRGLTQLRSDTLSILKKKIAPKPKGQKFDNQGTIQRGTEIINYAQHATATCCRKCIARWHNIPNDIDLNDQQLVFFADLIELYIKDRLPEINT